MVFRDGVGLVLCWAGSFVLRVEGLVCLGGYVGRM